MSYRVVGLCLVAFWSAGTSAAQAQSSTIRIEPRAVYGATVTLEEGVRVFRALPADRQVIVNPNGTPLNLNLSETNVTETRRSFSKSESTNRFYGGFGNNGLFFYRPCIPAVGNTC